ncbi:flagellar basal-body MS-ring/collar protein FliF [Nesterenkonia populi]|uniref:flagellar basal-body MS-ring/collar protein FliF n=1 Tax=Nesterenkonia populi TaxID=1591087 RepID=UPI001FEBCCD1|nr:flagellar basal-body MS-ring/collar protein FliF [Nesterenkonia populi]
MAETTTDRSAGARTSPMDAVRQHLAGWSAAQKTLAIIGAAVLALGGYALYHFMSQPSMAPVYTGLAPEDSSEIVEQLRADGVPYELASGGSTVLVPEEQVYEARIQAASAGLPASTRGGYGLLDDMGVTSSDFQQTATYKRALEGELASTVEGFSSVQTAAVILSLPEETVFSDAQQDATASIFMDPAPGTVITDNQVQSVIQLVSGAVDGLQPQNVAVVDADGGMLAAVGDSPSGSGAGAAAEYEERVAESVQAMLDTVVGRGNSTVAVTADVNPESAERLEETFEAPDEVPALRESSSSENYTGTGGGAAGVLGPDNIAVPGGGDGEGTYTAETEELENAINKVTETTTVPAGALNSQSISVAVDEGAAAGLDMPVLTAMVTDAAGLSDERGDALNVSIVPFSTADAEAAEEALAEAEAQAAAEAEREQFQQILTSAIIAGVLLLLLLAALLILRRRKKQEAEELEDLGESYPYEALGAPPAAAAEQPGAIPPPPAGAAALPPSDHGPAGDDGGAADPGDEESVQRRAELNALAAQDPERMAEHLRALMDEEAAKA